MVALGERELLGAVRRGHGDLEHETILLRLGERIRALVLDGILRGEDREVCGQRVRLAIDGDHALLHGLQKGRLGFGRSAVDFIGDQERG